MTPREAKDLVGRCIAAVDLQPTWEGDGPNRRLMHDPKITLDDGTVLRFVVEEHPEGSEYGVDIVRSKKPKERRKEPMIERDPYLTVSSSDDASCRRFCASFFGIAPERILRCEERGPDERRPGSVIFHVYVEPGTQIRTKEEAEAKRRI